MITRGKKEKKHRLDRHLPKYGEVTVLKMPLGIIFDQGEKIEIIYWF